MEVPISAKANCLDGPCGRTTHIIIIAAIEQITHLVVSDKSLPETTRYLVPIVNLVESSSGSIQLNCTREELSKMPIYDQMQFIPSGVNGSVGTPYMNFLYYRPERVFIRLEREYVPANELVIWNGASVEATDCHVGHVEEFLINPQNDRITDLVLRDDDQFPEKVIDIPVSQIDHFQEDAVYLKLDKKAIENLPTLRSK